MTRAAGALIGIVFGAVLCWSTIADPDVVRSGLLFEDSYLYLFFASAVGTAAAGQWLLRRTGRRAVLVDAPIDWEPERPQRRHVTGSLIFGLGWGVTGACPGPIATHVGQGIGWGVFTLVGVALGVVLFLRQRRPETEPACDDSRRAPQPQAA